MAVTTVHAQLIRYTDSGTQVIVNLKNTGSDVSIDRSSNTKIPTSVSTIQGLANVLGKLAFADTIADATTSASGLMTAAMVTKLNGIAAGANAYTHPNSGVTAGTYRSVTVNAQGHVTAGTNPTTLAGYGITDAAAKSHSHSYLPLSGGSLTGAIHLRQPGSGSFNENIRMHVSSSNWTSIVMCGDDNTGDSGISKKSWGIYTYNGTFSIAKNGTNLNGASSNASIVCDANNVWYANGGVLITSSNYASYAATKSHTHTKSQITDFPSSMPASDVYAWAKASAKPSYSWSEITGKPSTFTPASHTHNYAGSSSAGGAANSLAYFQNTSSTNVGQAESGSNCIGYISDYSGTKITANVGYGALYRQAYSTNWVHQIYGDYCTGSIAVRGKNNGTWQSWKRVLDESNYSLFTVTKTGSGASGTWGINVTGNAATATKLKSMDFLKVQKATPTEECIWCKID